MDRYLERGLFREVKDSLLYIERVQSDGRIRHGLVGMADLERYDFTPGSGALIRATERTFPSRFPHNTPIEPLARDAGEMETLYSFDLQQGGGRVTGRRLTGGQTDAAAEALAALCSPEEQRWKYGGSGAPPLLFAVGDGNHSLAAAKQCYEELKRVTPESAWKSLPARYALVEVVNCHDDALRFEPIHRVVSGVEPEAVLEALKARRPGDGGSRDESCAVAYVHAGGRGTASVPRLRGQPAADALQAFLDRYVREHGGAVDYIHGGAGADRLGSRPGCIGFRLPAIGKGQLFGAVMAGGVLPRKTFSIGRARDKRYYVEARRIR